MLKTGWGQRLAEARGKVSQRVFAPLVGCSVTNYSEYEREIRPPRLDTLLLISERSGRSLDWIATGEEAMGPLNTSLLAQVVEAVELESGDQDIPTRAKLISLLYNHLLLRQQKEQEVNVLRKGSVA